RGDGAVRALVEGRTLTNVELLTDRTRLPLLGDLFPTPAFLPFANVFSVGDVVSGLGVALWIVTLMRQAAEPPAAASERTRAFQGNQAERSATCRRCGGGLSRRPPRPRSGPAESPV